jgi:hypothetical protein
MLMSAIGMLFSSVELTDIIYFVWLFIAGAAAFFTIALTSILRARRALNCWSKSTGKIVDIKTLTIKRHFLSLPFRPVVSHVISQHNYLFVNPSSTNMKSKYQIGDQVEILFNPDDPAQATIVDWTTLWLVPFIGLFCCVTCLGLAVLFYLGQK